MSLRPRTLVAVVALVFIAGCSSMTHHDALEAELRAQPPVTSAPTAPPAGSDEQPITIKHDEKSRAPASKPKVVTGTGQFVNVEAARAPLPREPAGEGQITLNFESMPIQAAVQQILGGLLQENYTIAPSVTGNVTFSTARPITTQQAMPILATGKAGDRTDSASAQATRTRPARTSLAISYSPRRCTKILAITVLALVTPSGIARFMQSAGP